MAAADEYRPPEILTRVRALRASKSESEIAHELPPSLMYAKCEEEAAPGAPLRALYIHAFIEAGFVLDKPETEGGKAYAVCPVCGFVFDA